MLKNQNQWLSFLKARGSYAIVGNDTDPYRTRQAYTIYNLYGTTYAVYVPSGDNNPYGEQPGAEYALRNLTPEETNALEFGLESRFLNGRFGFDFTYYNSKTNNQILVIPVSAVTGFATKLVNAGEIQNRGFELALNAGAIRNEKFRWDVSLNYAQNTNTVNQLVDGINVFQLGLDRGIQVNAAVGEAYGSLVGFKYLRDDQGRMVVDANGFPMASTEA